MNSSGCAVAFGGPKTAAFPGFRECALHTWGRAHRGVVAPPSQSGRFAWRGAGGRTHAGRGAVFWPLPAGSSARRGPRACRDPARSGIGFPAARARNVTDPSPIGSARLGSVGACRRRWRRGPSGRRLACEGPGAGDAPGGGGSPIGRLGAPGEEDHAREGRLGGGRALGGALLLGGARVGAGRRAGRGARAAGPGRGVRGCRAGGGPCRAGGAGGAPCAARVRRAGRRLRTGRVCAGGRAGSLRPCVRAGADGASQRRGGP